VAAYKKSHARKYREALQDVPSRRTGELLKAGLPELSAWGRKNPDAPKVSPATINKQLGALGAIAQWAFAKGVIPEDTPWTNPFANMRVQGERSGRTSFETPELRLLFAAPVFTRHEYPEGGHGPAAFWLPILALFNGARQAELAGLTAADVQEEPETTTPLFHFTENLARGKKLKTESSQRIVPVHAGLIKLGFLRYVADVRAREAALRNDCHPIMRVLNVGFSIESSKRSSDERATFGGGSIPAYCCLHAGYSLQHATRDLRRFHAAL